MKYIVTGIVLLLLAPAILAGQTDSLARVWPSPPDRARIKFVKTISSLQSFQTKKGFFSGVFSFIFGDESSSYWLVQPIGIAVDGTGKIVVADPGANGVHVIDQEEKEYNFIGETEYGKFRSPVGCAAGKDGMIYISDSELGEVIALDDDYDAVFRITENLVRPTGLQFMRDTLYVADAGQHAVLLFSANGKYLSRFGIRGEGNGEFNFPVQLAVRDSIIVVDALNHRIQRFDKAGNFGSTFGKLGNVAGRFASPKSIAQDSDGNMYISDALMDCIQIFNSQGALLLVFGKNGTREGEFMSPNGITITNDDMIYIVDSLNRRIQIFQYLK